MMEIRNKKIAATIPLIRARFDMVARETFDHLASRIVNTDHCVEATGEVQA
jgi:hypothetical protein